MALDPGPDNICVALGQMYYKYLILLGPIA